MAESHCRKMKPDRYKCEPDTFYDSITENCQSCKICYGPADASVHVNCSVCHGYTSGEATTRRAVTTRLTEGSSSSSSSSMSILAVADSPSNELDGALLAVVTALSIGVVIAVIIVVVAYCLLKCRHKPAQSCTRHRRLCEDTSTPVRRPSDFTNTVEASQPLVCNTPSNDSHAANFFPIPSRWLAKCCAFGRRREDSESGGSVVNEQVLSGRDLGVQNEAASNQVGSLCISVVQETQSNPETSQLVANPVQLPELRQMEETRANSAEAILQGSGPYDDLADEVCRKQKYQKNKERDKKKSKQAVDKSSKGSDTSDRCKDGSQGFQPAITSTPLYKTRLPPTKYEATMELQLDSEIEVRTVGLPDGSSIAEESTSSECTARKTLDFSDRDQVSNCCNIDTSCARNCGDTAVTSVAVDQVTSLKELLSAPVSTVRGTRQEVCETVNDKERDGRATQATSNSEANYNQPVEEDQTGLALDSMNLEENSERDWFAETDALSSVDADPITRIFAWLDEQDWAVEYSADSSTKVTIGVSGISHEEARKHLQDGGYYRYLEIDISEPQFTGARYIPCGKDSDQEPSTSAPGKTVVTIRPGSAIKVTKQLTDSSNGASASVPTDEGAVFSGALGDTEALPTSKKPLGLTVGHPFGNEGDLCRTADGRTIGKCVLHLPEDVVGTFRQRMLADIALIELADDCSAENVVRIPVSGTPATFSRLQLTAPPMQAEVTVQTRDGNWQQGVIDQIRATYKLKDNTCPSGVRHIKNAMHIVRNTSEAARKITDIGDSGTLVFSRPTTSDGGTINVYGLVTGNLYLALADGSNRSYTVANRLSDVLNAVSADPNHSRLFDGFSPSSSRLGFNVSVSLTDSGFLSTVAHDSNAQES